MCVPSFSGCSRPPELSDVKAELIALIEESYNVNDILFGSGLVTEYDMSGIYDEYTDEIKNFETYYSDEQVYYFFYSPVVKSYLKDTDGDGIGDTETKQPTTIAEIKEMASKVYSDSYLQSVYRQVFEGDSVQINGTLQSIKPRYREDYENESVTGENGEESEKVLRKYKFIEANGMDYINSRGGRTVYDYETMEIVRPSDADTLVVEINAWFQDYTLDTSSENVDDWVSKPDGYSWHRITLYFVKQSGTWKLDSATY